MGIFWKVVHSADDQNHWAVLNEGCLAAHDTPLQPPKGVQELQAEHGTRGPAEATCQRGKTIAVRAHSLLLVTVVVGTARCPHKVHSLLGSFGPTGL